MTVEDFISKGKEMFFPNGVNTLSSLNSVDVALGNYAGATITCFRDVKKNQCSFQDYLHSHGLFSSRTSLYLLTTERINTEAVKDECAENAEKETMVLTTDTNLEVKYMISKTSIFSNNESRLTCFSLEDCRDSSFTEESRTDGFNPLLNGYTVVGISKDQKEYLDYDFDEDGRIFFKFPQSTTTNNIILHGPDVLNGFEVNGKDFLVGVISSLHGCDINYIWMKDGIEFCRSRDLPILVVKESGKYSVAIQIHGMIFNYSKTLDVELPQLNNSDGEVRQDSEFGEECGLLEPPIKKICQNSVQKINREDIIFNTHNIGKGSFGTVYKAQWLGTVIAVKEVKVKRIKLIQKIIDGEIQVQGRIRHPNILILMGYSIDKSSVFMISEFVDGPNLDELLFGYTEDIFGENFEFTPDKRLNVANDMMRAVSYLHNIDPPIIHTDIKPENILIDKVNLKAKLCDFGLSRVNELETLTCTGREATQLGTPMYQAPELILRISTSSKSSDVWSLACTLVELLVTEPIWDIDAKDGSKLSSLVKQKVSPSALELLYSTKDFKSYANVLKLCFNYDPLKRPDAIDLLTEFLNISSKS